jgi:hypothetical protein
MADAGTSTITFQASKIGIVQRIRSILVTIYLLELVGELSWRLLAGPRANPANRLEPFLASVVRRLFIGINLDRLYPDPEDQVNIPIRVRREEELRGGRLGLALLAAMILLVWPLLTGRAWLILPLLSAGTVLQFYSRRCPG